MCVPPTKHWRHSPSLRFASNRSAMDPALAFASTHKKKTADCLEIDSFVFSCLISYQVHLVAGANSSPISSLFLQECLPLGPIIMLIFSLPVI